MTYSTLNRAESLHFGTTVLVDVPDWAHEDGTCSRRMAVVIKEMGPLLWIALTSTTTITSDRRERSMRPRIHGDGAGQGNSLNTQSEVVLEPDGRLIVSRSQVIRTQAGSLRRGELAAADKFLIASLANAAKPGVLYA